MKGLAALVKKEMKEQIKTYKFLIVAVILLLLGLTSPIVVKLLPELAPSTPGMVIQFPTPSVDLVLTQYLQGLGQTGLLVAILVTMGSLARERERGTAAMTLSKPVTRGAFVLAKLVSLALVFAVGILLGAVACYIYTRILFGDLALNVFLYINLLAGLFLVVAVSVTLLFSAIFRNQLAAGGLALLSMLGQSVASGFPLLEAYTPGGLMAWASKLTRDPSSSEWSAVAVSMGIVIITTILAWQIFERKEL